MNAQMIEIMGPALVIGLIISLTHGLFGIKILEKNIIFIDLAIAQIAGLGLVIAHLYLDESWFSGLIALIGAMSAAFFFSYIDEIAPKQQEAIIGCSFVIAASLAILLLSNHPKGGDEIIHLLSGEILFITWYDIIKHAPIYIFVLVIWFTKPQIRQGLGFYLLFSLAITSSVQLVGVYVVFASLILPALAALNHKKPLLISWLCGILSVAIGIFCTILFDFPSGSMIVIAYVIVACCIALLKHLRNN